METNHTQVHGISPPHVVKETLLRFVKAYKGDYEQACLLRQAVDMNRGEKLPAECIEHFAEYVARTWDTHPGSETKTDLVRLMNHLISTPNFFPSPEIFNSGQDAIAPLPETEACPSLILMVAMTYVNRIAKKYQNIKGSFGCGFRLVTIAFIVAAKFVRINLDLVSNSPKSTSPLIYARALADALHQSTRPMSPESDNASDGDQRQTDKRRRLAKMEFELLHFLNYDLSIADPLQLVWWAKSFSNSQDNHPLYPDYTSADEGDDEMDED